MATIDDKVVAMSFESSKFESGVNSTISALDKLKASLKLPAASKGLEDVGNAAKRIDLSHIGRGIDAIVQKLNYFSVTALAIFANVAMKAVQAGAQIVKALTFDPILDGLREYETQINAIQVILSNTAVAGTTIKDVTKALDQLNTYADKTIYNFGQMTKNIGTFTAAGVDLDTAVSSIKGLSNVAALSGANAEDAARAMYQLSQAISAGRVQLMDWRSVENANMGSAAFKRALTETALQMGTLKESAVKMVGPMKNVMINGQSFRNSLASKPGETAWLTSGVLTQTLKQLSGDMTDAQLAAQGYTKAEIKSIQSLAKNALDSATTVKTVSQLISTTREQLGTQWADTFKIVFGGFLEAKQLFTGLSNAIGGFVQASGEARNKVLQDWKDLGGRTLLIDSIKTAFQNLGLILKPIKEAFRDIFPATTGKDLLSMTKGFAEFTKSLKPSEETVENLRRTFRGVFAALDIGKQIVSGIFTVFKELFGALGGGNGGFLDLTASIGDWIVSIDKALKKGDGLKNFFEGLGKVLAAPVEMLSKFAGAVGDVLSAISSGGISKGMEGMTAAATPLQVVLEALANAWDSFSDSIKNSVDMKAMLVTIGDAISGIGEAIGNAASSMNFEAILSVIKTGLFAALVLMFKQFLGKGSFLSQISQGFSSGIISNISGIFSGLNGSMKAMQQNIKAKTLKEIAIAIALLAASVLMLSLVDPKRLNASLGAMTILFSELIGAMALLNKIAATGGFLKLPIIIAGLIGLAIAIDLLTIAVLALSRLSWDELLRGLAGIGGSLGIMVAAVGPLGANSGGLIRAGVGIGILAVSLNILALAVKQFAGMSMEELGKGLGSIAIGLGIMTLAMKTMPAKSFSVVGLIAMGVALNILALAVQKFAGLNLIALGKGLGGIAVGLGVMVVAMRAMPPNMGVSAVQLLALAGAIWILSDAVVKMGGMSLTQMAKGLGSLAGAIVILATALKYMAANVRGAAALTITAAAIGLLAPALVMLGKQSWSNIVRGLVSLAGALAILGLAGMVLAPVAPAMIAIGLAVALIGGGIFLAGAGLLALAAGISALAIAGPAGIGILIAALDELIAAVPKLAVGMSLALLSVVEAFAKTAPQFVEAMVKIIDSLLDVIIQSAPKVAVAMIALVDMLLKVLEERQDEIIAAGLALLIALLKGIRDNIAQVTVMVIDIVVTFLRTLAGQLSKIIAAGVQVIVSLLKGIADSLPKIVTAVTEIIVKFIAALATNYVRIITAGADLVVKLVEGITRNYLKIVTAGADAIISFVTGLGKNASRIVTAGVDAVITFIEGLGQNAVRLANAAGRVIVDFLNGLTAAINTYAPQIRTASLALGWAIIDGMTLGLAGRAEDVYNKAREIAGKLLDILKAPFDLFSPSKTMMEVGSNIIAGMTIGIGKESTNLYSSADALSNGLLNVFTDVFQTNSPSKVTEQIGKWVGEGFIKGLRGSQDDIRSVFTELNQKLTEAMKTARETIATEEAKLSELRKAKKPDTEAIKKSQDIINQSELLLKRSLATRKALTSSLKNEKTELIGLVTEYEKINDKIEAAQEKIKTLKQERDAFEKSLTDQFATLPEIQLTDAEGNPLTPEQQVQQYLDALAVQSQAVATYKTTLEELRKLGLDDATYEKLLKEGTADQAFANQLLAGGKTAVEALNKLDTQLMNVSKSLAVQAAKNLKQAGIDGAEGLLKGLQSRNAQIKKAMEDLIAEIIAAVKKKLSLRSPSRVFYEIGTLSMQGLADGFTESAKIVTDALVSVADTALNSMQSSIRKISDIMATELNPNPVITPILDLSQVRSQIGGLAALTNVTPITAAASYGQAAVISAAQIAAQMEEVSGAASLGPTIKYEQNNYSPKSLTEIEIYRQTKNQLSQVKSLLAIQ
jgi:tape measure domain-containing protein